MKKILILAPHTDDGEIGCGGTAAKMIDEGHMVYYCAFSVCEESVPDGFPKNILETEVKKATKVLGIAPEMLHLLNYPVRRFNEYRQNILDDMVNLNRKIRPDIVFMPCINDVHQDHQVIAAEGIRAFKNSSMLCYEMVWNNFSINTTSFSKLNRLHIDKKCDALECYSSQKNIREYLNRQFVESLAKVRGVQIGADFAEAFEVLRWII